MTWSSHPKDLDACCEILTDAENVGLGVGDVDGDAEGESLGEADGDSEGDTVGLDVGTSVLSQHVMYERSGFGQHKVVELV